MWVQLHGTYEAGPLAGISWVFSGPMCPRSQNEARKGSFCLPTNLTGPQQLQLGIVIVRDQRERGGYTTGRGELQEPRPGRSVDVNPPMSISLMRTRGPHYFAWAVVTESHRLAAYTM